MKHTKKTYRIIHNNDGGTLFAPFFPFTDLPFSLENFVEKTIGHLLDTQVDAVTWTLGTEHGYRVTDLPRTLEESFAVEQGPARITNMYCHETDVGERFYLQDPPYQSKSWYLHSKRVKKMIEEGNDPPKVVIEHAHKHNLDVFLGFRMNDCHDAALLGRDFSELVRTDTPMRFPVFEDGRFIENNIRGHICKLKREHPELLIGEHEELTRVSFIAFDYSHRRVRDFRLALIEEACEKYDVDGIELDFLRSPIYFKPGKEQASMGLMTEFMGKVRAVLDRIGRSRDKYLKLAIRTLPPIEASRAIGLDVQSWLEEDWIDVLIAGVVDRRQLQLEDVVQTAHKHNCPVYASIKADIYIKHGAKPELFRAIAANHYRAGVNGIYLFNMNALRDAGYGLGCDYDFAPLREIGSFEKIKYKDKHYVLDNKGSGHKINAVVFDEWSESMQNRVLRSEWGTTLSKPELPTRLEEDKDATVHFRIADEPREVHDRNLTLKIALRIFLEDLTGGDHLVEISLNGNLVLTRTLSNQVSYCLELPVDVSVLKCGENILKLSLKRQNPNVISELRLNDMQVLVKYYQKGENQKN